LLAALLADMGIVVNESPLGHLQAFGLRVSQEQGNVRISHVIDDSRAQKLGLAPGDLLVAIDSLRVTYANLDTRLQRIPEGEPVTVLAFREDVLISLPLASALNASLTSLQPLLSLPTLSFDPVTTPEQLARRAEWLAAN
jgi:predicted metalloprotease with PDZ domain